MVVVVDGGLVCGGSIKCVHKCLPDLKGVAKISEYRYYTVGPGP